MGSSLKDKSVKGAYWSAIDNIVNYGVSFILGVILARLLSPDEYGLIGIILIFIAISNTIIDGGLSTALIRKTEIDDEDYCTAFYTNLVISTLITGVLFLGAPLIATFFNRNELVSLTRVLAFELIINAVAIIQNVRLTRSIDFKTQTKISLISHCSSGILGIIAAVLGCGVWALVLQRLSSRLLTVFFLYLYNKWFPKLIFSWERFLALFSFSWKLLVAQVINSLWTQIYQVVIGKFYQPVTLGEYTRAKQFADMFSTNFTTVVRRVSFPALSTIQDDIPRMREAYRKIIKISMLVSCSCLICLAVISKPLIFVLIGEKWVSCVPFLQILCITFILYPLEALNCNMITIQGRSDQLLKLEIVQKALMIIPVFLGISIGIYWMLFGSMFVGWINFIIISTVSGKNLQYPTIQQIKDVFPSLTVSILSAFPTYMISLLDLSDFATLFIQLLVYFGVFVFLCSITKLQTYSELKKILYSYIRNGK